MLWKGFVLDCRWKIQLPTTNLVNVYCRTKLIYYVTETFSKNLPNNQFACFICMNYWSYSFNNSMKLLELYHIIYIIHIIQIIYIIILFNNFIIEIQFFNENAFFLFF